MAILNDGYTNAVVGKLVKVTKRNHRGDGYGLATLECEEPFATVIVRTWVANHDDAMMLIDSTVIVHDCTVYPLPV